MYLWYLVIYGSTLVNYTDEDPTISNDVRHSRTTQSRPRDRFLNLTFHRFSMPPFHRDQTCLRWLYGRLPSSTVNSPCISLNVERDMSFLHDKAMILSYSLIASALQDGTSASYSLP
jgi:hypothetical protein